MKKTKILALAMSVSLVLGGAYIIDSKTNIAYAEEEKNIAQQIEEKKANIQELEKENSKLDKEVSDLEKDLENLNKLNKELEVLTSEADKLYEIYATKYEEWERLDKLVKDGIAKREALCDEYNALVEQLKNDPTNKDLESKKTAKAYQWGDQVEKVKEDTQKRTEQYLAMKDDEEKYAEADAKYLEKKAEVSEEEEKTKGISEKIEEKKEKIKNNSRKINVLGKQIKTLEDLKSKEDKENIDDNEDGDENQKPVEQQIADDKNKLDKLKDENKKQNEEIDKLKEQMVDTPSVRNEFENLKKDRDTKYNLYVNTNTELDKRRMEYSKANILKTELANDYFDVKKRLEKDPNNEVLKKEFVEKLDAWRENNKKIEKAEQACNELEEKIDSINNDYKTINKRYKEFKTDLEAKEDKNQELEFKIGLINKKIKKNNSKIKALNSKLEANNAKVLNKSKENANKEIDGLSNLSAGEKKAAKDKVNRADTVEKVNQALENAKKLAEKNLAKAKEEERKNKDQKDHDPILPYPDYNYYLGGEIAKDTKKKTLSAKTVLRLKEAVERSKTAIKAAELLMEIAPKKVADVKPQLLQLIKKSKELQKIAEKILAENGYAY